MTGMGIFMTGLLLGLSLLLAIGPQNILVIRQGIRREGVTAVILVCLLSDVVLFSAGTLGAGYLSEHSPLMLDILRWCGIGYLLWFAVLAARDALRPPPDTGAVRVVEHSEPGHPEGSGGVGTLPTRTARRTGTHPVWVKPMLMAVVLTWLNPNTYLDAFVFIGGVGAQYGESGRWVFAAGAFCASLLWFPAVGYGAAALSRPLSDPRVWRWINTGVAVVLSALALKLLLMS